MDTNNIEQEFPLGLYWKGKRTTVDRIVLPFQNLEVIETINESRATRKKDTLFRPDPNAIDTSWRNKLIWGDNKYVMSALLEQFAGKINLIYIDPPFATGANFNTTVTIGDTEIEHTKEASAIEELAYRDTWGKGLDSFLQMLYDRLILMKELLSEKGSIFLHVDWRVNSHVRLLLDEIFGVNNYCNEIAWHYSGWNKKLKTSFEKRHDSILYYKKSDKVLFNSFFEKWESKEAYVKQRKQKLRIDDNNREYVLSDAGGGTRIKRYIEDVLKEGVVIDDVWEIDKINNSAKEALDYPTQKPECLLERIIKSNSDEGDIIADFFCGSGTTAAVAEKLGRRWITCDLGRYAIHTTRKRMLEIEGCKPFEILNVGKYERQYWQTINFGKKTPEQTLAEYLVFVLKLYKAEALPGSAYIHGKKGNKLVHIGGVDAPITLSDIQCALQETRRMKQKELVALGWEWEMGLHDVVEQEAAKAGVKLTLLNIPREAMDKRAVDAGDIQFFELAYLETDIKKTAHGYHVILKDFIIPNLDLVPAEVKKLVKKWSDYIDYWSVDWDYKNDTFHNQWQGYRTKKDRSLELSTDLYQYEKKGDYKIMVKVIDIFGNDTTHIIELQHR
ncbi:MAG TPA: site-specific DNA-methyltransferase [Ignavibacteriales bacterium]|nr:site-specific DNA-methyltransferase [Ignavibacteriales bacterium]